MGESSYFCLRADHFFIIGALLVELNAAHGGSQPRAILRMSPAIGASLQSLC
jgi:hypothetical protein